eukprot:1157419-Pelagomonas_calceolata.AAC.8
MGLLLGALNSIKQVKLGVEDNSITCTVNNSCSLEGATLIVKLAAGARNPSPCLTDQVGAAKTD